jgi:histidine triad (HIT) family protein
MKWLPKHEALARLALESRPDCMMCEVARTAEPIVASEHAIAVLDRYAARPGHVLVVLRRHEEQLARLAWHEYEAMHRLAWQLSAALQATLAPRRIYVAALGSAAPLQTSFPHVHLHIIPLADGGELDRPANVFTWTNGMYVFDDEHEERALRARLAAAAGSGRPELA